ncbi:MAG: hypothetical protein ACXAB0_15900, partial [Candidatus Thorarchaeota archaeon]
MSCAIRKRIRVVSLLVLMFLISMPFALSWESNQTVSQEESASMYQDKRMQTAYDEHSPIYIAGDDNLTDTAAAELWEGDGSEEFPYIIESYNITLPGISG